MSSVPIIRAGGGPGKKKAKKPNAVRRIMDQEQRVREKSVAPSPSSTALDTAKSARSVCKNPDCTDSDVRDGMCQSCGRVLYESNIVAEVTFGESANGAAVVHGSYLAADQGGIRPAAGGLAFRRVAGAGASEARERSLREAKQTIAQFGHQLQIAPHVSEQGFQVYKQASSSNFIQGRKKNTVAAVCLYAVCRKEDNNRVMLIDLADIIKTDVFLLGRSYKDLLNTLEQLKDGTKPIIIEDLIFRFASKLEFLHDTNKVALSAIRIAQRMRHDNITHGRRPAGICGAALIMAARAHNYRRTVREVVYIAKVTMATLQERMEEFANVPSAQMTIHDFHESKALPEASHDPPFVYKQSKEWQEKHAKKPKKRKAASAGSGAKKRQKTAQSASEDSSVPIDPALQAATLSSSDAVASSTPLPESGQNAPVTGVDGDGFAIPFRKPTEADLVIANNATADVDGQLNNLVDEFGDAEAQSPSEVEASSEMAMAAAQGIQIPGMENMKIKPRDAAATQDGEANTGGADDGQENNQEQKKKEKPRLRIDEDWEMDENNLEKEMEGHLNNPVLIGASAVITQGIEQQRGEEVTPNADTPAAGDNTQSTLTGAAAWRTPASKVSDDPIVHEDEFKDDPEVMHCRLSERDVQFKEMIWANHNKDYMRKVQEKIFQTKMSSNNPPKQKRSRAKKPRIGEGQTTPAGSAIEAAQNMLRTRAISTKLDYSRMDRLFEYSNKAGPGSTYGGASSIGSRSALPSSAGSDSGSSDGDDDDEMEGSGADGASTAATAATTATGSAAGLSAQERVAKALAPPEGEGDEDEADEMEHDGGFNDASGFQEDTYGEEEFDPFGDGNGGDEEDEE
ncbi:hypothetical protein B0J18DRAFT_417518 [Chaetomium sp. MPI-SDFR-AT-0129]|nr:hypothetical protein B0J18DRAFT_417518 [Chaetomium sp. MPI-SDFR-AT-0129]